MILMQGQQPSGFKGTENPRLEFASMVREKRGYSTGAYAKPQQCSKFLVSYLYILYTNILFVDCAAQAQRCPSGPPGRMLKSC